MIATVQQCWKGLGMIFEYRLVKVKDIYISPGVFQLLRTVDYCELEDFTERLKAKAFKKILALPSILQ